MSINILVLVFNLIPGFPLDGGGSRSDHVEDTGDRNRATGFAAILGRGVGSLLIAGGGAWAVTARPSTASGRH